ncbi:hypothetical protein DPQ33_10850 [Oceanidesulfovibrio indonesiensis]|uniref:Uncharacterized protein n=1 Tax=Oceanidesulfovibrio indonesiensis TaxID=54767 RepID=A0A7M3MEL8_9BACT|nr:hypothetical protein [Oceanidesulfovibrio indonesiensis]TVM16898.1 hypothetical protein DPQ33_10850 [Oceanidesulfovibrio indonesiensis]
MADARKIFSMSTFAAYIKGVNKEAQITNIKEMLEHLTGREISEDTLPFAEALGKAYVYEQHPELCKMKGKEVLNLGDNVSVTPMSAEAKAEADAVFARIEGYQKTLEEQSARIKELEAAKTEFETKAAALEKDLAEYKGKVEAFEASAKGEGDKVIVTSQQTVEEYIGKVNELLEQIENVKKHGVVTVAAGEGAAAAPAGGAEESGGVPDDFGFGASGSDGDGFGF